MFYSLVSLGQYFEDSHQECRETNEWQHLARWRNQEKKYSSCSENDLNLESLEISPSFATEECGFDQGKVRMNTQTLLKMFQLSKQSVASNCIGSKRNVNI